MVLADVLSRLFAAGNGAADIGHSSTRITLDVYRAARPERDAAAAPLVADLYDDVRTATTFEQLT